MKGIFETTSSTICALATAPGEAGLGLIRVSGSHAVEIVEKIFQTQNGRLLSSISSHRATVGQLIDPSSGKFMDQAVVTVMRAPRSYTGEDTAEISAHGNPRILSRIIETLLQNGARLAERGEFTKRAFLNGKLDLTQAEGVIDAVRAVTGDGIDSALEQLTGKLGGFLKGLRADILSILSPIEACIDFPEEDVPEVPRDLLRNQIEAVLGKIEKTLEGARRGRILREGFSSVIVGKPNVGKSSLLNALLRERRAIVTDIPGTTRDTIEEWVEIEGIPMRLVDTAGIRATEDRVEEIGISRSREALAKGDLVLLVLDRSVPLESHDLELLQAAQGKKSVVVLNKMDLSGPVHPRDIERIYSGPLVSLSLIENKGLENLEERIVTTILADGKSSSDTPLITRLRHQECLERAKVFLHEAGKTLAAKLPLDLAAGDLRGAAESIGEITGEHYTDDLLEKIFSEFCVGK